MTREELEHAIRAACDIAGDDAVYVFGSQAILGQYPDAPAALRRSVEVDVSPRTRRDRVDAIDGAIGELSQFHATFGFYVHGMPIEETAMLPPGWRERVIPVRDEVRTFGRTGLCLEGHDLAPSKLAAFRDKDRDFVRVLPENDLLRPRRLIARIRSMSLDEAYRERLVRWVTLTFRELRRPGPIPRTRRPA